MKVSDGLGLMTSTGHTTVIGPPSADGMARATPATHDPVKRPAHYTTGDIEVIDFIEQVVSGYPPEIGYHIGNLLKYVSRAPHKAKLSEDLCKAEWYLKRAINKSISLKPKVQRD